MIQMLAFQVLIHASRYDICLRSILLRFLSTILKIKRTVGLDSNLDSSYYSTLVLAGLSVAAKEVRAE